MKTRTVVIVIVIIAVTSASAYYLFNRRNEKQKQQSVTIEMILSIVPEMDKPAMTKALEKMTQQELQDSYKLLKAGIDGKEDLLLDAEFVARIDAITAKYNIFT